MNIDKVVSNWRNVERKRQQHVNEFREVMSKIVSKVKNTSGTTNANDVFHKISRETGIIPLRLSKFYRGNEDKPPTLEEVSILKDILEDRLVIK